MITGAVKIFSEHCNWKYENDFFLDKELIALIGESALANEDKVKFLIAWVARAISKRLNLLTAALLVKRFYRT